MDILPIAAVREEDTPLVGQDLVALSKLLHNGFPIPDGLVVTPPSFKFKTVIEHFQFKEREVFEQSLHLVRQEISKIPPPQEFISALAKRKIDIQKVWSSLLTSWFDEVRSKIWREGFSPNLTSDLRAKPVFFLKKTTVFGEAYFDYRNNLAHIVVSRGTLPLEVEQELDSLTKRADKKLYLQHTYKWVVESSAKEKRKKLYLVGVGQFTQYYRGEETHKYSQAAKIQKEKNHVLKIFLNAKKGDKITSADGIILKSDSSDDFDTKLIQLINVSTTIFPSPVILRLPDMQDSFGGVRGTLRLVHNKAMLKSEADSVVFARHKKGLINISVAVPFVRSVFEFMQIKRELAALQIARKASLKLWVEFCVPENILNIEDYCSAGFDGVILNLDELAAWIGGFDHNLPESIFYKKGVSALSKFLEGSLKILHKSRLPVIATGSLVLHDDVLACLLKEGLWGISVSPVEQAGISEYVSFMEKRMIRSRMA